LGDCELVCWLGVSAMAGLAYRKVHLRGMLSLVALILLLTGGDQVIFPAVFDFFAFLSC